MTHIQEIALHYGMVSLALDYKREFFAHEDGRPESFLDREISGITN